MLNPISFTAITFLGLSALTRGQAGPPFTPLLPVSSALAGSDAIDNTGSNLTSVIGLLVDTGTLDNETTSFSIDVYSVHDSTPLYTHHFSAPGLAEASEGVQHVDSNTIYRLASISKVLTVYLYLMKAGDLSWNQPITKYIPELAKAARATVKQSNIDVVRWDQVTISALASQLSGMARDPAGNAQIDASYLPLGLPPVPPLNGSFCPCQPSVQFPCTRKDFFENLLARHPIVPALSTPIYSNLNYQLLAYALESIIGVQLSDLFQHALIDQLHLNSTYYSTPPTPKNAIIPFNDTISWYSTNIRQLTPGGAYYSTINDMRRIGLAILNSTHLPPALTRSWLKPHSFTPDAYLSVGAPWEIVPFPPAARYSTRVYSKAGDIGLYSAMMGLIPDYGIGFTVLVAGQSPNVASRVISDLVLENFVPAVKEVAAEQSKTAYEGTYRQEALNSSAALKIEQGDLGSMLRLESWIFNDADLYESIIGALVGVGLPAGAATEFDLSPTGLMSRDEQGRKIISWRAYYSVVFTNNVTASAAARTMVGSYTNGCRAWAQLDAFTRGGIALDEVLFRIDPASGAADAVNFRGLLQGWWGKSQG